MSQQYVASYARMSSFTAYACDLTVGTGTLEDALDWLEYCNGKGHTHWADQRRANNGGRDEPHHVKYWALGRLSGERLPIIDLTLNLSRTGNEMYGPWQIGRLSAAEYITKAQQWAHALKILDPSIVLISCGQCGYNVWDAAVLQGLVKQVSSCQYLGFSDRRRPN